ncbi:NAC domain-containing protein 96-like [Cornus florida]|uniref:NAC domain-containing protein 96-like n=1 Tax=Cornus florida TaxID=4283 RepID=UPI00289A400B|nr:NAC domain-containing protein 96-like [Cornus florida]XP_059636407.1 NAC domain-containing protein 96-like [Cornus florida]XP_059636408.1 NAC domain-containing protein 96-like [Cornus florida]
MCPPAVSPADIAVYWTDAGLILSLEEIIRGCPLPGNVFADVNPYQCMPSDLPDGIWYLIRSEEKKDAEFGFWRTKGEACVIFTNSSIAGWRTTLEFYEGRAPLGQKTNWVMQEYWITHKGACESSKPKESISLCRVFLCDGQSPKHETRDKKGGVENAGGNHFNSIPSAVPNADNYSGEGHISKSQVKSRDGTRRSLTVGERLQELPLENLAEDDYILRGDFLELDDLAGPESPSSSSDNSSCLSFFSDERFDSSSLLQQLDDEVNQELQGKNANFQFSVSASISRPNKMLMRPPTLGSLISGKWSNLPIERTPKSDGSASEETFLDKRVPIHVAESWKAEPKSEGASNSHKAEASARRPEALSRAEKKALVGRMKRLKRVPIVVVESQKAEPKSEGTSNSHKVEASSRRPKAVSRAENKALVGRMKRLKDKYLCFVPF